MATLPFGTTDFKFWFGPHDIVPKQLPDHFGHQVIFALVETAWGDGMKIEIFTNVLDAVSFFAVTVDLYGRQRLAALSEKLKILRQSAEIPSFLTSAKNRTAQAPVSRKKRFWQFVVDVLAGALVALSMITAASTYSAIPTELEDLRKFLPAPSDSWTVPISLFCYGIGFATFWLRRISRRPNASTNVLVAASYLNMVVKIIALPIPVFMIFVVLAFLGVDIDWAEHGKILYLLICFGLVGLLAVAFFIWFGIQFALWLLRAGANFGLKLLSSKFELEGILVISGSMLFAISRLITIASVWNN